MVDGTIPEPIQPFIHAVVMADDAIPDCVNPVVSTEPVDPVEPTETVVPAKSDPPAGGRLPCELRLMIWEHYFHVVPLAYHTLTAPRWSFAHRPALLDTDFRAEAVPYYLSRLCADLDETEARYRKYLKERPADSCPESKYKAWVTLLETTEIQIRALRREIEAVKVEVFGEKVVTEKDLREAMSILGMSI